MHALSGILSGFALLSTLAAMGGCTFLSLSGSRTIEQVLDLPTNSTIIRSAGAGIWFLEEIDAVDPDVCVEYTGAFEPDAAFRFARFFSIVLFFGGISLFTMLMIASCRNFSKSKYMLYVAAGFFVLSLICLLLLVSTIC